MKAKKAFPKPAMGLITLVVFLAALLGGYFKLVAPKRHEAAALATEIADVRSQIEAATAPAPTQTAPTIRVADIFKLSRAMPNTADIPDVLLQLSQIADATGISFKGITPGVAQPLGSYQKVPIDLLFEGHFYDLADFLYRLRNLVSVHDGTLTATGRLFSVESVSFDQGTVKFPEVQAQVQVDAFIFGDGTPSATPPSALAAPVLTTTTGSTTVPAATTSAPTTSAPTTSAPTTSAPPTGTVTTPTPTTTRPNTTPPPTTTTGTTTTRKTSVPATPKVPVPPIATSALRSTGAHQ